MLMGHMTERFTGWSGCCFMQTITMGTAKLLSRVSEADGEDPFTDIEQDKNELGVNETVLDNC